MAICKICGAEFDPKDVDNEYGGEFIDRDYFVDYPDADHCLQCAVNWTNLTKEDGFEKD